MLFLPQAALLSANGGVSGWILIIESRPPKSFSSQLSAGYLSQRDSGFCICWPSLTRTLKSNYSLLQTLPKTTTGGILPTFILEMMSQSLANILYR